MKHLQNFHSVNNTFHGQVSVWVKTLQMNLVRRRHWNVSSFTKCHRPSWGPLDYREKRDVVSFLHGTFTFVHFSRDYRRLLNHHLQHKEGNREGAVTHTHRPFSHLQLTFSLGQASGWRSLSFQAFNALFRAMIVVVVWFWYLGGGNPWDLHLISQNALGLFQQLE